MPKAALKQPAHKVANKPAPKSAPAAAKKVPAKVSPVVSAVTKAFSKGPLRAISVRFSKGKLSFGGIDPAALPALVSAFSGLKLPVL